MGVTVRRISLLLVLAATPCLAAEGAAGWRVLVIHAADFYVPGSIAQDQALRAALSASAGRPVEFHNGGTGRGELRARAPRAGAAGVASLHFAERLGARTAARTVQE
jgi:hypothetical protein